MLKQLTDLHDPQKRQKPQKNTRFLCPNSKNTLNNAHNVRTEKEMDSLAAALANGTMQ